MSFLSIGAYTKYIDSDNYLNINYYLIKNICTKYIYNNFITVNCC